MRLVKEGKYFYCYYHAGKRGQVKVSTRCTNRDDALEVVRLSRLKEIELASRAGVLTNQAIGLIMRGSTKTTMETLVEEWSKWMSSVSLSPATIHARKSAVCHFIRFTGCKDSAVDDITIEQVSQFVNRTGKAKASSRIVVLECLRLFLDFCQYGSHTGKNVARLVRLDMNSLEHTAKEPKELKPISDADVECLLEQCRLRGEDFWAAAIKIGRETGLRLGDVTCLEKSTVGGKLTVWTRKAEKRLELDLSPQLRELLSNVEDSDEKYFFPVQRLMYSDASQRPLLSMQFRRIADRCGVKGSYHCLRHSRAKEIFNEFGISEVSRQLAHSNEKTSKGYVR